MYLSINFHFGTNLLTRQKGHACRSMHQEDPSIALSAPGIVFFAGMHMNALWRLEESVLIGRELQREDLSFLSPISPGQLVAFLVELVDKIILLNLPRAWMTK
jgi:hypothetical protein